MQTPIEETMAIIKQLEQLQESMRASLSQEAREVLDAVEQHERNPSQTPEVFLEGTGFYNRMLDSAIDGPIVQEYRILEDTLLRARWLLEMLRDEEAVGEEGA